MPSSEFETWGLKMTLVHGGIVCRRFQVCWWGGAWSVITLDSHICLLALKVLLIMGHRLIFDVQGFLFIPVPKVSSLSFLSAKNVNSQNDCNRGRGGGRKITIHSNKTGGQTLFWCRGLLLHGICYSLVLHYWIIYYPLGVIYLLYYNIYPLPFPCYSGWFAFKQK